VAEERADAAEAGAGAGATLNEVLGEWQGLGYPRRARALWLTAGTVSASGWPTVEKGLTALPGIGVYTTRALLAFSDLALAAAPTGTPDVNVCRVPPRARLAIA